MSPKALATVCAKAASAKHAGALLLLDLTPCTAAVCDFFIVCTAESNTQAQAIATHILRQAKSHGLHKPKIEGAGDDTGGSWILIDFFDVVVHIMLPEVRQYYNLEKLWTGAVFYNLNEETGRFRKIKEPNYQ